MSLNQAFKIALDDHASKPAILLHSWGPLCRVPALLLACSFALAVYSAVLVVAFSNVPSFLALILPCSSGLGAYYAVLL
eukprot:1658803-Pyramimonas_sp.AAC.1